MVRVTDLRVCASRPVMTSFHKELSRKLGNRAREATVTCTPRETTRGVCASVLCLVLALTVQAEGPSKTPLTDRAVENIRRQAQHMARGNRSVAPEFFSALVTANFVQARVSSLNYSILSLEKKILPTSVEQCLEKRAGICGNHVAAFLEISQRLGLRARPVEFYFRGDQPQKNHSHICVEVFYRGQWRLFDITWGTYFPIPGSRRDDLADVTRLRSDRRSRDWAITNQTNPWYQQWIASNLDPLEYLDAPQLDILRGRRGTILLRVSARDGDREIFRPVHQPNFVGRNQAHQDFGPVVVLLENPNSKATVVYMNILGLAGKGSLVLFCDEKRHTTPFVDIKSGQTLEIRLPQPVGRQRIRLEARPEKAGGVAYVVYRAISLRR